MLKRFVEVKGLVGLKGNDEGVLVNVFGQIKDSMGNDIPTEKDEQGHLTVYLEAWDGKRVYRVIDLIAIQFKGLRIPVSNYNDVIAFVIDGDKSNTHAGNIGYRFKNGKLESTSFPGYYYIPGYTQYVINREGEVINTNTNTVLRWNNQPSRRAKNITGGYYVNRFRFFRGVYGTLGRHRALCLVFKPYPDNMDSMVVNHIDGVPGNDDLDNLEIVTRSENNEHAWKNDLRTQNHVILSRNILTNEVREHLSITRAAHDLGYSSDETIRVRLVNKPFGMVFHDGYQFKYKDDPRDWIIPSDPVKAIAQAKKEAGLPVSVISRRCSDLKETLHISISAAGIETGNIPSTISFRLNKDDRSPLNGYQYKADHDIRPFPDFTPEEASTPPPSSKRTVVCRNLLAQEQVEFESVRIAKDFIGETTLQIHLKAGKQPLYATGWQCKYSSEPWEEIEDPEEAVYRANTVISARLESTGEVITEVSSRRLAERLKLDPKTIRKVAYTKGTVVYKGYRFRLGESDLPWPSN